MDRPDDGRYTEVDLIRLLQQIIERETDHQFLKTREFLNRIVPRADLTFVQDGIPTLVVVERVVPQTAARITELLERLVGLREHFSRSLPNRRIRLVLAVPGVLTSDKVELIESSGFELWDREWIFTHAAAVGLSDEVHRMFGYVYEEPRRRSQADELGLRLRGVECGRPQWAIYQKLCGDILEYLFCPPLETPIPESTNGPRISRRDFVIPNYAADGFWYFLRSHYRADYLVVDAKNYCGLANKAHVLQLANYLSHHGTGLFGMIITRNGMDNAAAYTCREQWMLHNKMIITLNDDDLFQMLETKKSGDKPEGLVRQKVEDFRLRM